MDAVSNVPPPVNEPVRTYAPGSAERAAVEAKLKELAATPVELTMTVGGQPRMGGGDRIAVVEPHNHAHVLGHLGNATDADVTASIEAAAAAAPGWRALSFDDRAAVFLKAAELLAGPWRSTINAATMLGQSKSVYQAEIDAACELIDFWRYNTHFAQRLLAEQPSSVTGEWDRLEYRPLEGFVLAITPFNFTSIAANLPTAPALLGNVVLWKPSPTQQFSAHYTMRLLEAAGLPPGVINLVTGDGQAVSQVALPHRDLAGVHFTGSTGTFQHLWRSVGENIAGYRSYPRLVGETGGKDFVIAHPSADPEVLSRGADPGRVRIPGPEVLGRVPRLHPALGVGPAARRLRGPGRTRSPWATWPPTCPCSWVRSSTPGRSPSSPTRWPGPGGGHRSRCWPAARGRRQGYFVQPTVLECSDPDDEVFRTEYFGPILAVHVFDDARYDEVVAQAADVAALRADRRDLRPGPSRHRRRHGGAALRGRQLLHQRQANRRGGRPAAVRRRPGQRDQRQGGLDLQPDPLGQRAGDQGAVRAADRLPLPAHGLTGATTGCQPEIPAAQSHRQPRPAGRSGPAGGLRAAGNPRLTPESGAIVIATGQRVGQEPTRDPQGT